VGEIRHTIRTRVKEAMFIYTHCTQGLFKNIA